MKRAFLHLFFFVLFAELTYGQKVSANVVGDHLIANTNWALFAKGPISVEYLNGSNKRIYKQTPFNYNSNAMNVPGISASFANNDAVIVYVDKPLIKVISAPKVSAVVNSVDHLIATTDWSKYSKVKFLVEEIDGRNQHVFEALPNRPFNPNALRVVGIDALFTQGTSVNVYNLDQAMLSKDGSFSINTTDFSHEFSVNGNVRAKEIKVENTNWPDYVFAKDYPLLSIKETERYIKEKGHLPGIPSAEEVKSKGVELGDINAKLLQKIEELTLHLIQLSKENERQQQEIDQIKNK